VLPGGIPVLSNSYVIAAVDFAFTIFVMGSAKPLLDLDILLSL